MSGNTILLAEDDMLIAFDISDFLKSAGCEVIGPFAGVSEALTAAATHNIDLAVLNISLRGEPVWPVVEVLRERRVPFLFLTGYPKSDQLQNTIWLEKPFISETLLESGAGRAASCLVRTALWVWVPSALADLSENGFGEPQDESACDDQDTSYPHAYPSCCLAQLP